MNISEAIAAIKAGPNDITLYPGAPQELIEEFQAKTGITLPSDLVIFYQECNGFESAEDLFRIVPLDEALENRSRDIAEYGLKSNQFYVAEFLLYCDTWTIEIDLSEPNTHRVLDGGNTVLTHSFVEFIARFLTGGVYGEGGLL
jgi:hypothetical protein